MVISRVIEIVLEPEPQIEKGPFELATSNISREIKAHRESENETLREIAENIDLDNIKTYDHQVKFPLMGSWGVVEYYELYFSLLASQNHLRYARTELTVL